MTILQKIIVIILSLGVMSLTLELIRRRKLREEYALLWLLTGLVILAFALFPGVLYSISQLCGLHHLTTLLLVAFLFLLAIVLHYSTVLSRHTQNETELAQRIALLEWKLEQHTKNANGTRQDRPHEEA